MKEKTLVPGIRTLRAMAKVGFITLDTNTGLKVNHWTGATITAYYVKSKGPKLKFEREVFAYKDELFQLRYFNGCLCPFVCRVDWEGQQPSFV